MPNLIYFKYTTHYQREKNFDAVFSFQRFALSDIYDCVHFTY